jgi:hypothetical protein
MPTTATAVLRVSAMALLAGGAGARPDHPTIGRAASLRSLRGQVRAADGVLLLRNCWQNWAFSADRPFLARSSKPPRPPQFARTIRMKFAGGVAPSFYLQLVEPYPRPAIGDLLSIVGCTG